MSRNPTHGTAAPRRVPDPHPPTDRRRRLRDAEESDLIVAVRAGDMDAAAALYVRHHDAALRAARAVAPPISAEALASEGFAAVVATLLDGRGPDRAIQPYLVATIRHLFLDKLLMSADEWRRQPPEGDPASGPVDPIGLTVGRSVVLEFLAGLPDKWREVLWLTMVLQLPTDLVSVRMGLSPDTTAALTDRAREGLRKAYLLGFPSASENPRLQVRQQSDEMSLMD